MSAKQTLVLAAAALAASAAAVRSLIDNSHTTAVPYTHETVAEHLADFAADAAAFAHALSEVVPDDEGEPAHVEPANAPPAL